LSATLLESELFGYEKGAFTGAAERRRGRFELADGGTIFLDEIGEIDHATQVKLLRVLETRSFERVGGTETIHCDIRLIAATNRDLRAMTAAGTFREDLFYRLSVINLDLPPLRERKEEIPLLVKNFVSEFAADNNKPAPEIPQEVINELMSRRWQGNIRELRNCIECMVALNTSGRLEISDIPEIHSKADAEPTGEPVTNPLNLENSERELILKALKETNGNRAAAARMLGISRRTLYRKLEKEGLEEE
jgi:DNA-binding NtrC family response regulator